MNACPSSYRVGLFLGVETHDWRLPDGSVDLSKFMNAATFALAHGIDTLFIKVFDGPSEWYGGNFSPINAAVTGMGVNVIPYGYLYGNAKGSSLATETALTEKYLNAYGSFIADIETEWEGHADWAITLNGVLASNPNAFYVSTLADPYQLSLTGVLQALAPSINVLMPQVYDDFLGSVYLAQAHAAGFSCIQPTFDLSAEFGPNDILAMVNGVDYPTPISIWEYGYAEQFITLFDQITTARKIGIMQLSPTGEVADFTQADQFQPAKTQDACGFFSVAVVKAASKVGTPPSQTPAQIIAEALAWYAQYDGDNSISNTDGMALAQEYALLPQVGLHYQAISDFQNLDLLRAWIRVGYPVIIAGWEAGFYDLDMGDVVPYYWNVAPFNHIITLTGVRSDGNFIVRDTANVTDLNNPNSLRPGPRHYDAAKMGPHLISATVIVPPWMPRPPAGFDPRKDTLMGIPTGWKDDGTTLTAPNGIGVVRGNRSLVLNSNWDAGNVPMEAEKGVSQVLMHANLGGGTSQTFRDDLLWWTQAKGVIREQELGIEIFLRNQQIAALNQQIAQLQAQIAAGSPPPVPPVPPPPIPADMQAAINQAESTLASAADALKPYVK